MTVRLLLRSADEDSWVYTPNLPAGVVIVTIFSLLKIGAVGSWIWALKISWWRPYHHKRPTKKGTMQTEVWVWQNVSAYARIGGWNPFCMDRTRWCRRCLPARVPLGDRTYHCVRTDKHYPMFDHYCNWIWVVVYLDTIKAYMLHMYYYFLENVFTIIVCVWAITEEGLRLAAGPPIVVLVLSSLVAFGLLRPNIQTQTKNLVLYNRLHSEHPKTGFQFWMVRVTPDRNGLVNVRFMPLARNPWDLGKWNNLHSVFGKSIWTWPLFWVWPERVTQYGRLPGNESDLPLGGHWRAAERGEPNTLREIDGQTSFLFSLPTAGRVTRRSQARSSSGDVEV